MDFSPFFIGDRKQETGNRKKTEIGGRKSEDGSDSY